MWRLTQWRHDGRHAIEAKSETLNDTRGDQEAEALVYTLAEPLTESEHETLCHTLGDV